MLSAIHKYLDDNSVISVSIAFSALIYALLSAFSLPPASNDGLISHLGLNNEFGKVLNIMLGGLSLYTIFYFILHVLMNIWAYPILGVWLYKSSSGNFGMAKLVIRKNQIEYSVDIYSSAKDVIAAYKKKSDKPCFSVAQSNVLSYKEEKLDIIYNIPTGIPKYPQREGLLALRPTINDRRELFGTWRSFLADGTSYVNDKEEDRSGTLEFLRPKLFIERFEKGQSQNEK